MPDINPHLIGGTNSGDVSGNWALYPELVLLAAPESHRDFTLPAAQVVQICVPNPRRIGLTIITNVSDAGGTLVSPFNDPASFGVPIPTSVRLVSFAIDDLYSLVSGAWYAYNGTGTSVRVVEYVKPA